MRSFPAVAKSKTATSSKQKHSIHNRNLLRWAHWSCRRKQCLDLSFTGCRCCLGGDHGEAPQRLLKGEDQVSGPQHQRPKFGNVRQLVSLRTLEFHQCITSPTHYYLSSVINKWIRICGLRCSNSLLKLPAARFFRCGSPTPREKH